MHLYYIHVTQILVMEFKNTLKMSPMNHASQQFYWVVFKAEIILRILFESNSILLSTFYRSEKWLQPFPLIGQISWSHVMQSMLGKTISSFSGKCLSFRELKMLNVSYQCVCLGKMTVICQNLICQYLSLNPNPNC